MARPNKTRKGLNVNGQLQVLIKKTAIFQLQRQKVKVRAIDGESPNGNTTAY